MVKLLTKIQTLEAQKSLLTETVNRKELLSSKIISSLQPKVGKQFENPEIEGKKIKVLQETRKKLIMLAIEEKTVELQHSNSQFEQLKENYQENNQDSNEFYIRIDALMNALTSRLNSTMNKKVNFHAGRDQPTVTFVQKKTHAKKKRKWTRNRKRKNRAKYKKKVKEKKKNKIAAIITKIKENNTVINLSREEVPDATYMFLAKGLGYVPSQKVDVEDLKYDATEFVRKVAWKAFFKANPEIETNNDLSRSLHNDIKVSGYTYPDFSSPLLEEVKTKLFGWIANHSTSTPKPKLISPRIPWKEMVI